MSIQIRERGVCSKCGTKVTRVLYSEIPTCRADGSRFVYTNKPDDGFCIFRCETCSSVIDDTWKPMNWT